MSKDKLTHLEEVLISYNTNPTSLVYAIMLAFTSKGVCPLFSLNIFLTMFSGPESQSVTITFLALHLDCLTYLL